MAQMLSIDDWVERLAAIPAREFTLERVQAFLAAHGVKPEPLEPYLFFSKGNYTRNLIFKNDLFECMGICWEVGQASRIHNHRGQNCWKATPVGRLRVQNFRVENRDATKGACRLAPNDAFAMDPDHAAAVNPLDPRHPVLTLLALNPRAVRVNACANPVASCETQS